MTSQNEDENSLTLSFLYKRDYFFLSHHFDLSFDLSHDLFHLIYLNFYFISLLFDRFDFL